MNNVRVLDIDNCIADDSWRIKHINWDAKDPTKRYHNYHSLAGFDKLGNEDLLQHGSEKIIFLTARPSMFRALTQEWLRRIGLEENEYILYMRATDCHLPSVDLKRDLLLKFMAYHKVDLNQISGAYDDRIDVVEMYKSLGVKGQLRKIHNQCAFTKPKMEKEYVL